MNEFESAAATLLQETGCSVARYRKNLSGIAYTKHPDWLIEVPNPTTAMRFGVFAHEVGHQVLHRRDRGRLKLLRWQEEAEAWAFALACFTRFDLPNVERSLDDGMANLAYIAYKQERRRGSTATYVRGDPERLALAERWLEIAAVSIEGRGDEWTAHDVCYTRSTG